MNKDCKTGSERPLKHGISETVKVLSFSSKLLNGEHTVQGGAGLCPCVPRHSFFEDYLLFSMTPPGAPAQFPACAAQTCVIWNLFIAYAGTKIYCHEYIQRSTNI